MKLSIHKDINHKLNTFRKTNRIPNIIFYGPNGSGKRTIVRDFINSVYNNDQELIKNYVMVSNCASGKGIKFIREDLKFFAKTHININSTGHFKTILMTNADKLTIDAQSALRRCIEQFNHTTRFFIIVENKQQLLKPILSRFCEIYVPLPLIDTIQQNLHDYVSAKSKYFNTYSLNRSRLLRNHISSASTYDVKKLINKAIKLYDKGYSGLDIMSYIETEESIPAYRKYMLLLMFNNIKNEIRCEKLMIYIMLYFIIVRSDVDLENIQLM